VADTIKCNCPKCGAKYRLPVEYAGRSLRCKRCTEKFSAPREQTLEDSILTWLNNPQDEESDDALPEKPRVISMPNEEPDPNDTTAGKRIRGTIRMKSGVPKEGTA
jgi:hypothetical protein